MGKRKIGDTAASENTITEDTLALKEKIANKKSRVKDAVKVEKDVEGADTMPHSGEGMARHASTDSDNGDVFEKAKKVKKNKPKMGNEANAHRIGGPSSHEPEGTKRRKKKR